MKKGPHPLDCFHHKEDRGTMKTISEIIGGTQALLLLEYELQDCFPGNRSLQVKMKRTGLAGGFIEPLSPTDS